MFDDLVTSMGATVNDLVDTMQIVEHAVLARQKDNAVEALTVFLLQFMSAFGRSNETFVQFFPVLESIKLDIDDESFVKALPNVRFLQGLLQKDPRWCDKLMVGGCS